VLANVEGSLKMHSAAALGSRRTIHRLAYGVLAVLLLAAAVLVAVEHGTGWWQLTVFAVGPDIALLFGAGANLEPGQLHPRAVPLYNMLHRYWLPVGLTAIAALGLVPLGFLVGGLAWCFHISLDRAVGYGLRTRDGHQRS
jgi:hypothetical protein